MNDVLIIPVKNSQRLRKDSPKNSPRDPPNSARKDSKG